MCKRKRKLFFWGLLTVILLGSILGLSHFVLNLYFQFTAGPQLFAIRHQVYPHLYAYADKTSYFSGDTAKIFVSVRPGGEVKWVLGERKTAFNSNQTALQDSVAPDNHQNDPNPRNFFSGIIQGKAQKNNDNIAENGAGWEVTLEIPLENLKGGWYVLSLQAGSKSWRSTIIIKPNLSEICLDTTEEPAKIAYILPTNTWNSYNPWGGKSHYSKNRALNLSFNRPCEGADPFLQARFDNFNITFHAAPKDVYSLDLLDSLGIKYDLYTDEDLHSFASDSAIGHCPKPGWVNNYEIIMIGNHSEYWTKEIWETLHQFANQGGSLVLLSGNFGFWLTKLDLKKRTQWVNKTDENQWQVAEPSLIGILGIYTSLHAMHTYAPYSVSVGDTNEWIFEGTGLKETDLFGAKSDIRDQSVGYNGIWQQMSFFFLKRGWGAASGLEFDRTGPHTPANWVTVAEGLNPKAFSNGAVYPDSRVEWYANGGAQMGFYEHPGGGIVFNVGSVAFPGSIPFDPQIRKIIENVIKRVVTPK